MSRTTLVRPPVRSEGLRLEAREPIYTQDLCKEEEEEEIFKQGVHIHLLLLPLHEPASFAVPQLRTRVFISDEM